MLQFIHEYDMAQVLVRSVTDVPTGLYNVTPNEYIALKDAIMKVNPKAYPFPIFPLEHVNKVLVHQNRVYYLVRDNRKNSVKTKIYFEDL